MSAHGKRYPRGGGQFCETCHEWGGVHMIGCPEDETDDSPDNDTDDDDRFPVERDNETLDAFDFIEQNEHHITETK